MTFKEIIEKNKLEKLNDIGFLKFKKDIELKKGLKFEKGIDYPLKFSYIKDGIREDGFEEGINIDKFLDSMAYILGIDNKLENTEDYKKLLKGLLDEPAKYYISKIVENFKESPIDSLIYTSSYNKLFSANKRIELIEKESLSNLLDSLKEGLDSKDFEWEVQNILNSYEEMTLKYENFAPPYLHLAYIYEREENHIKAKLYYEKFLEKSDDNKLKDEVREELLKIEDYVNIESAKTYLAYGEAYKAINYLKNVSMDYFDREELYLLMGRSYYLLGESQEAEEYLQKSFNEEITEDNASQLAMILVNENKLDKAEKILKSAEEKIKDSFIIYYNLASIYYVKNNEKRALEYYKKAYKIDNLEEIEKIIKNLKKRLDS